MSTSDKQWEFVQDVAKLIRFINLAGDKATFGGAWRPDTMQQLYYYGYKLNFVGCKDGERPKVIKCKPKSRTLSSRHPRKFAVDFNLFIDGVYVGSLVPMEAKRKAQKYGDYWESLNPKNRWGGNFKKFIDVPHFERRA